MKSVDLKPGASAIEDLFRQAREEDVIVKLADGSEFFVSAVDEFDQEIVATRRNQKRMTFLENRAKSGQPRIPLHEVKRRLGLDSNE